MSLERLFVVLLPHHACIRKYHNTLCSLFRDEASQLVAVQGPDFLNVCGGAIDAGELYFQGTRMKGVMIALECRIVAEYRALLRSLLLRHG